MRRLKNFILSLLTSGKYTGVQDVKDMDAVIRLIVLNIIYAITSIIIAGIGVNDMRGGLINQGLLELIIGFLMFTNLLLLRTELPFMVGGFIIIAVFGAFCGIAVFSKSDTQGLSILWIYSYPLMSIFTLGLPLGLVPAALLLAVIIGGILMPDLSGLQYTIAEVLMLCGVYSFVFALTAIYEYVRSIKDHWLSRQDSYMNMVFENSPDIILLLDKDGMLVYCADVFLQRTHIPGFEYIRKAHFTDVFSLFCNPAQLEEIIGYFRASRAEKKPVVFERTMDIGRDGYSRHYEIHYTPMQNNEGDFQGAFILFHDMTEIVEAKVRTEQASLAKSNFLSSMSHEIRTPLNAIIGMTTIAANTTEPERKNYCLDRITGASTHLLGVINDILDMSKIEEGKFELSCTEFDICASVQQVAGIFEFRIAEKNQKLILTTDPSIPKSIISDEQRLAQVITNIVSNAVKFTPIGGSIGIDVKRIDHEEDASACVLEIRISDTGIGISKEQQNSLFRSFVQVDSSISRKYGGTGLGLAISKKIIEMMQGSISIESELGHGSTFIFTMKAELPGQCSVEAKTASEAGAEEEIRDFSGKKILLVEDVDINREIVIAFLEETKLDITEAVDGQQAFDKFSADPEKFDLIFMDIHMPGVDGYEATRLIRAFEENRIKSPPAGNTAPLKNPKGIPIIAMTANVFREDVEKCLAAGMNGHIGKPLAINEVMATLRKYLAE